MNIHVVLVQPKIPSNTGNIIRLCANVGVQLHLVKPLGFDLADKKLRRAGLDYHEYASLLVHENWAEARQSLTEHGCQKIVALTTKLSRSFYEYDFGVSPKQEQSPQQQATIAPTVITTTALVFGSETAGLAEEVRADIGSDNWLRLPMRPDSRSLNLANTVAICVYELWRQQGFIGDVGASVGYDDLTPYDPK
ncbi:tRNA (cytidine(34)-2'-O)-methyltransferase [Psychrobacter sp. I-STPA10]|uniref:tRNA (cytidine(34)-2'-O)-methyltransferase n=1 Tax=Psychrobacter sp. I-STPA10 TaxID=2585769 RepID=UPI001E618F65|nr:tRNA (cytidine(34)-2'-O)-methyltransferase [Psychrobacter sp. I-STPA10]